MSVSMVLCFAQRIWLFEQAAAAVRGVAAQRRRRPRSQRVAAGVAGRRRRGPGLGAGPLQLQRPAARRALADQRQTTHLLPYPCCRHCCCCCCCGCELLEVFVLGHAHQPLDSSLLFSMSPNRSPNRSKCLFFHGAMFTAASIGLLMSMMDDVIGDGY